MSQLQELGPNVPISLPKVLNPKALQRIQNASAGPGRCLQLKTENTMAKQQSILSRAKSLSEMTEDDWLGNDPLREFYVWWMEATEKQADRLEGCVKEAKREEDVQQFLQKEPMMLVQHLGGGHGRYVILGPVDDPGTWGE